MAVTGGSLSDKWMGEISNLTCSPLYLVGIDVVAEHHGACIAPLYFHQFSGGVSKMTLI